MKTPEELVRKIDLLKSGDKEAFNAIYEESYKYLHTCVIHVVKNEDTAQDMLQETYAEIYKSIGQLNRSEDFLSWASTIANRKCYTYIKKDRDVLMEEQTDDEGDTADFFESVSDDEAFIPENIFDDKAKVDIIRGIIDDLTDVQRACVIGFYYNEQKQDEIADQLGIPVNTVKSHLNRAKSKIKDSVSDVEKKQGIKLYSFAPFMLLLFAYEAKAYAAEGTVPAMAASITSSSAASSAVSASKAAATVGKTAATASRIKVIVAALIGVAVIGGVTGVVLHNRTADTEKQEEISAETEGVAEADNTEALNMTEQTEPDADAEETTPDATVDVAEESVAEPELIKVCNMKEAGYEYFGNGYGGVIIVQKDGMFGAVDYNMNEIVPCEHESFKAANNKGYFVLVDGDIRTLYSPEGKEIYSTPHRITATENCFIVEAGEIGEVFEDISTDILQYYDYDGNMILETHMGEEVPLIATGGHDGVVLVRNFTEDLGANHCKMEVGKLHDDGTVAWQTEYDGPSGWIEGSDTPSNSNIRVNGGGASTYNEQILLSGLNNGYYVTYHMLFEWGFMKLYDADSNLVTEFNICGFGPDGSYSEYTYNEGNDVKGYFYDGAYNYNRGTKLVVTCGDKNILIDAKTNKSLAVYDFICMAEDDLWLVGDGDKWGYIDPDGNEIAMYDDASAFTGGYALIIKDGRACLIDTDLNVIEDLGEADSVSAYGELLGVERGDSTDLYRYSTP